MTGDPQQLPTRLPTHTARQVRHKGGYYFVNEQGDRLPSVTTILNATKPAEDWDRLLQWRQRVGPAEAQRISSTASRRGMGTHRYIQKYLEGDRQPCSPAVQPYWESLEPVLQEIQYVRLIEGTVFHQDVGYAGKVDCVASYRGVPCVCEWKTADKPRRKLEYLYDYPLQVVAYCGAVNHVYQDYGVYLNYALLVIAVPGMAAEVFWLEPETIVAYWNQWQARVEQYGQQQGWD
ncbi:MAG: exonuclease [Leptolyngbyaceae cyanobacterium bins.59]|nr:exonuclease [Leptolyngbyaceae cyanobacterium bins.59]